MAYLIEPSLQSGFCWLELSNQHTVYLSGCLTTGPALAIVLDQQLSCDADRLVPSWAS